MDIIRYFDGFNLKANGVQIVVRPDNTPTQEAFVDFECPSDAAQALELKNNRQPFNSDKFGDRYVQLIQVSRKEMQTALSLRFGGEGILKMKGIPFNASSEDIRTFLSGYKLKDGGISFIMRDDGTSSGMAFLEFETPQEALRCLELKHRKQFGPKFGNRFCQLEPVGRQQMEKAKLVKEQVPMSNFHYPYCLQQNNISDAVISAALSQLSLAQNGKANALNNIAGILGSTQGAQMQQLIQQLQQNQAYHPSQLGLQQPVAQALANANLGLGQADYGIVSGGLNPSLPKNGDDIARAVNTSMCGGASHMVPNSHFVFGVDQQLAHQLQALNLQQELGSAGTACGIDATCSTLGLLQSTAGLPTFNRIPPITSRLPSTMAISGDIGSISYGEHHLKQEQFSSLQASSNSSHHSHHPSLSLGSTINFDELKVPHTCSSPLSGGTFNRALSAEGTEYFGLQNPLQGQLGISRRQSEQPALALQGASCLSGMAQGLGLEQDPTWQNQRHFTQQPTVAAGTDQ